MLLTVLMILFLEEFVLMVYQSHRVILCSPMDDQNTLISQCKPTEKEINLNIIWYNNVPHIGNINVLWEMIGLTKCIKILKK